MMELKLNADDEKLLEIHSNLYPFVNYGTTGKTWFIRSTDYDEEFKTYKAFIRYITDEVKESLLCYALNGELSMLAEVLEEV